MEGPTSGRRRRDATTYPHVRDHAYVSRGVNGGGAGPAGRSRPRSGRAVPRRHRPRRRPGRRLQRAGPAVRIDRAQGEVVGGPGPAVAALPLEAQRRRLPRDPSRPSWAPARVDSACHDAYHSWEMTWRRYSSKSTSTTVPAHEVAAPSLRSQMRTVSGTTMSAGGGTSSGRSARVGRALRASRSSTARACGVRSAGCRATGGAQAVASSGASPAGARGTTASPGRRAHRRW